MKLDSRERATLSIVLQKELTEKLAKSPKGLDPFMKDSLNQIKAFQVSGTNLMRNTRTQGKKALRRHQVLI